MPRKPRGKAKAKQKKPEAAATDEVMDLKAAADFLKVSKPTFYRWLAQGKLKGFKAGQQWRFYRADLEKFLQMEEPSAILVDSAELEKAVQKARKARGLPAMKWDEPGQMLAPELAADTSEEGAVLRTVFTIIGDALDARASDIHMDANADEVLVRYRVDGVLSEVMRLPRKAQAPIVARLKLMGDMDVSERRLPRDGRIAVRHRGRDYDVRVATMPAIFGESAILRLLDQSSVLIGLDRLGLSNSMREAFERRLHAPNGLVVVTGLTGSGRTTTLYSALNLLNSPRVKIVTVEDPVEYRLRDVMQVHVNRKAGLTFGAAAKAFMRCDPDIVMVGALRDLETAEICMQAAMTGHIVLTTMLPGEAVGVITRLLDMGIEPFILGASLSAVLAQRLVRMVCPSCKTEYKPSPAALRDLGMTDDEIARTKFYRGAGCDQCRDTGYYGRTAIFELLEVDDRLREMIASRASAAELRAAAVDVGMTTMLQDGLEKAKQGITTVEEVLRVLAVAHD